MSGDATSQMLSAGRQFSRLLKQSVPTMACLLLVLFGVEVFFRQDELPALTFGALVGVGYAFANLWLLFRLMAPFFFFRQRAFLFLCSLIISLALGATLFVLTLKMGHDAGLGYAFGLASPAVFGVLYSFRTCATT